MKEQEEIKQTYHIPCCINHLTQQLTCTKCTSFIGGVKSAVIATVIQVEKNFISNYKHNKHISDTETQAQTLSKLKYYLPPE